MVRGRLENKCDLMVTFSPDVGLGAGVLALMAMIAFASLIFASLYWHGPHIVGSITSQGTTVGISTGQPRAPVQN